MAGIPLVNTNSVNDINTSIIAIKKEMKSSGETEVNVNVNLPDTAIPVDEVTSGNMHSVTSNAVANAINYSTSEINTGKKWIDGKPIYRIILQSTASDIGNNSEERLSSILIDKNVENVVTLRGFIGFNAINRIVPIPNNYIFLCYNRSDKYIYINNGYTSVSTNVGVTLIAEYTKTTD